MEKNNFNKAYIYIIAIFGIGVAISNIISFFSGVGFALIGASVLLILAIMNIFKHDELKRRFWDIFVLIAIEILILIILFFAYDFSLSVYPQYNIETDFPLVMRNICAIYSLFAIAYIVFRYISEINGKKYKVIEFLLGNRVSGTKEKKVKRSKEEIKKNKELENGTLEPKPSSLENNATVQNEVEESEEETVETDDAEKEEDSQKEEDATSTPNVTNRTNFW